jgi:hypothetical protein
MTPRISFSDVKGDTLTCRVGRTYDRQFRPRQRDHLAARGLTAERAGYFFTGA